MLRNGLALLFCVCVQAHSLYIMPQRFGPATGEQLLFAVHSGDAFPNSEDGADPSRFVAPRLIGAQSETKLSNFRLAGLAAFGIVKVDQPGALWLVLSTQPRAFELDAERFVPYLLAEGLDWVVAERKRTGAAARPGRERYSKYAKALLINGAADMAMLRKPVGLTIEIVPLADPTRLKPGASLPVQVLFRGKPAAGIQVEAAWAPPQGPGERKPAGRTGADGKISIPLTGPGRWRLNAVQMEKCSEPAVAEWESYWASLTFELPVQ